MTQPTSDIEKESLEKQVARLEAQLKIATEFLTEQAEDFYSGAEDCLTAIAELNKVEGSEND